MHKSFQTWLFSFLVKNLNQMMPSHLFLGGNLTLTLDEISLLSKLGLWSWSRLRRAEQPPAEEVTWNARVRASLWTLLPAHFTTFWEVAEEIRSIGGSLIHLIPESGVQGTSDLYKPEELKKRKRNTRWTTAFLCPSQEWRKPEGWMCLLHTHTNQPVLSLSVSHPWLHSAHYLLHFSAVHEECGLCSQIAGVGILALPLISCIN